MYKTAMFIIMSKKNYDAADLSINDDATITLEGHLLFDMNNPVPVIVRDVGCVGYGIISEITFTKNGSTKVSFTLRSISTKTGEAAYTLYMNQISDGSDSYAAKNIPGLYQSRTTGKANSTSIRFRDDDTDLPHYLK